jgi:hypothetical protein
MAGIRDEAFPLPDGVHTDCCIVYDRATGEIVHIHEALIFPNAQAPQEDKILADALALASEMNQRDASDLATLRLARDTIQEEPRMRYRVDINTLRLVKEHAPRRQR